MVGCWRAVADRGDPPARIRKGRRRLDHGEVGLAAGAGERRGDERGLGVGVGDPHDQHVLGEPAVVATHRGRNAQCETLLAEQSVAAVAAAVRPDRTLLGEVHDVLHLGVARPRHICVACGERRADGVHARDEHAVVAEGVEHGSAHPGHDLHVHRHIGRVGDLHTDLRDRRADRTHAEGDHVHRAPLHRAGEQLLQDLLHLVGIGPVVGGSGVGASAAADVGAILDASDIAGVGPGEEAVRPVLVVQASERAGLDEFSGEVVVLLHGAVAPVDLVGRAESDHFVDPASKGVIAESGGNVRMPPPSSRGHL